MTDAANHVSPRAASEPDPLPPRPAEVGADVRAEVRADVRAETGSPDAFNRLRYEYERSGTRSRLIVVIPMYNEAKRIERTIEVLSSSDLHRSDIGFCFVDDGSTDDTVQVLDRAIAQRHLGNAEIYRLNRNLGKGGAVRTGMLHAAERARLVGFLDADLSLNPSEVLTALARLELTGADALMGERVVEAEKQPKLRRIASLVFRRLAASLVPTGVRDSQCAMKLFRADVARDVFGALETTGFAFDVEVLGRLHRGRYTVTEAPVLWEHQPGSQVNAATDAVRMIREVLNIRRVLRSQPVATEAVRQST